MLLILGLIGAIEISVLPKVNVKGKADTYCE